MEGELERSGGESWVVGDPPAHGGGRGVFGVLGVSGNVWWWGKSPSTSCGGRNWKASPSPAAEAKRWEVLVDRFLW